MSTTPVTDPSPEVLGDKDACLAAAFQMLCERMGKLEETTEHWLRRERMKECSLDGVLDSHLLGLNRDVELWRDYTTPSSPPASPINECWRDYTPSTTPPLRSINEAWQTVNIAMPHLTTLANLDQHDTQRVKTLEAMARLGLPGKQLHNGDVPLQCADVGLESDFIYLADAVSEEIVTAAVQSEPADLHTVAYSSHSGKHCSWRAVWPIPPSPGSTSHPASLIPAGFEVVPYRSPPSAKRSCASSSPITGAQGPHRTKPTP